MSYVSLTLRGLEVEITYRIRSIGPGSCWDIDWEFISAEDNAIIGRTLTADEEGLVNDAIGQHYASGADDDPGDWH